MSNHNVACLLSARVQQNPEGRALVYQDGGIDRVMSLGQLEQRCDSYAQGLRTLGLRPGDKVLLMEPPGPRFVALSFALFKLGCVPVLIDPGMGVGSLLRCVERLRPDILVGVGRIHLLRSFQPSHFASVRRAVCTDGHWPGARSLEASCDPKAAAVSPHGCSSDQLAAILFTSGSTGPAKGVEYRHGVFAAQVEALQHMFQFEPGQVDMPGFPLFALFSVALGLTCVLPDLQPSRPASAEPTRLIRSILDWQVNNLQGSPAIWEKLGRYCLDYGIELPSVRRVITFGAPISLKFLETWNKLLAGRGEVYTPYGATEVLPISLISGQEVLGDTAAGTRAGKGTCVGRAVPGVQVRILKVYDRPLPEWQEDEFLPPGEVGEIVVSAEQVTWAYYQDAAATEASKIRQGERIWHRMGDLGYLDEVGRLWIVGRKNHRVEGAEQTYYPACAEGIADEHPDVRRSALVAVPDPERAEGRIPALVVELLRPRHYKDSGERNRISRELRERLAQHPPYGDVQQVFFHKDFPVDPRHNVKIDREALGLWARSQGRSRKTP